MLTHHYRDVNAAHQFQNERSGQEIDLNADVTTDPCLVIEVTSPSTARFDRSEKLLAYQRVESL